MFKMISISNFGCFAIRKSVLMVLSIAIFLLSGMILAKRNSEVNSNSASLKASVIKLKAGTPPYDCYYGAVRSLGEIKPAFTSRELSMGVIKSTQPVGTSVMSRVTDSKKNIVNYGCDVAKIESNVFQYDLNAKEAYYQKAKAQLDNAKIKFNRYGKLVKTKSVSQKKYDRTVQEYYSALSDYDYAAAELLIAKINLRNCTLTSIYSGVINKIFFPAGNWSYTDYPVLSVEAMTPIGIDLKMDRALSKKILKKYPVRVYPVGSNIPLGTVNEFERLSDTGIFFIVDNYLTQLSNVKNEENYPVIEGYFGQPLYVSRFNVSLEDKTLLAVPVESLHKDDKGYFVWRGKGQKVCQPDSVIVDKFQIEKVYVMPGGEKTYINGPCKEYQVLEAPGKLQEYDFILGRILPKGLKDNGMVFYKKYKYLFNPGETVKVEIPELSKPGYYVPASSLIQKATDDCYVYINDNGKARRTKVMLVGGNDDYYRIEGKDIKDNTEVLLFDKKNAEKIFDGVSLEVKSIIFSCVENPEKIVNTAAIKLSLTELPESEKNFYAKVDASIFSSEKFTSCHEDAGFVHSTLPKGTNVMSQVTDLKGNIINPELCEIVKIDKKVFEYGLKSAEAQLEGAVVVLKNAEIEYNRCKRLLAKDVIKKETYDDKYADYLSAKADYVAANANKLDAANTLKECTVTSVLPGVIDEIISYPGTWAAVDYPIVMIKVLIPVELNIKLDNTLAEKAFQRYPKKIYPIGCDTPVGVYNECDRIKNDELTVFVDNYLVLQNDIRGSEKHPVIEGYWGVPLYVSRFNISLGDRSSLAVPMESLRKDDKGYYVWKGKGQKVCQPDSVIADKFQIEKVYVKPGEYRAFINGPCKEYLALEDSGNLQEYDFILGKHLPNNLKSGETVLYRKYKYLFELGDIVKVDIPSLVKPGFYVPASSVIQKATDDCYVYINNNGQAQKVNVRLVGGNDNYYRIEGNEIKNGVEVLSLDDDISEIITDGAKVNVDSVKYLFQEDKKKVLDVCAIKLNSSEELPESEKRFYGTVRSLETAEIKFSSEDQICGNVTSTLPVNTPVFSKVTDKNGNIINKYFSRIASIARSSFERQVKIAKLQLKAAQAEVNNAKIKHDRYEQLGKTKSVSQKVYDASIKDYYSAIAYYYDLKAQLQTAQDTLDHCLVTSVYTGLIDKIVAYPGDWTNPDMVLLNIKLMEPIGIDIQLNKSLARIAYKDYPKKIYPIGSAKPIGAFNEQDQLNEPRIPDWDYGEIDFEEVSEDQSYKTALTALLDNYTLQINKIDNENKYPVIDSCWDSIAYVSRFDPSIGGITSLAIPVESLREDNSGFYVWKCVGQKVYQPDTMIADKFQIQKVYIKPGVLKTYINGPSREYQILENPGKLQEYDCVLGDNIPDGLKDNDTVVYRKYKFMFNPGDVLKVEIPDLVKPGFYVPASSVVLKGTDDGYVYVNDSGKAKLLNIKLVGGNDKYFRIEGKDLEDGAEIIVLGKEISEKLQDGSVINVKSVTDLFPKKNLKTLKVSAIKLKRTKPEGMNENICGKIISVDEPVFAFSTRDRKCGHVASTLPVGANVMSRRTEKDGKMLDSYGVVSKIDSSIYEYNVNEKEALVKSAEARLSNAKIGYERNKKLYEKHAINKEKYDDALEAYEDAKAECNIAKVKLKGAKSSLSRCTVTSAYSGVVKKIIIYPGSWSDHMYPMIQLDLMTPIGLKIEMDRKLALNTYKQYSKKVYPIGSDMPVGTLNEQDSLTETGLISLLDNYMVCINNIKNDENCPIIEGYWGHPLYVSRFNVSLQNKIPLAVPVESLCKDDKGFFVWRGKGQKVCQAESVIADKFQIEKIHVMPGREKTYINGPCKEYQVLEDPGKLQEYDFILGENRPKDLKDNGMVFYKKYKYLFNPGDIVKVEIPELLKPGYYVPILSVIQKATDDCYVYINDNGKAKLTQIEVVGGNDYYYRIDGKDIKDETEVLVLDSNIAEKITDGAPVKISSVTSAFLKENRSKIDVSVMKLKTTELPDSEKTFYGTVKLLDTPSIKFSNWKERYARIATTLPVGFPVMAKITDENNKVLNADASTVATMETNSYDYILKSKEAEAENAENQYKIAQKILAVYEKLIKSHVVSQKDYDQIVENYYTAKAYDTAAKAGVLIAKENVDICTRYSPYSGVIGKVLAQPGTWSTRSWPILTINLMSPMGLDIPINRILAGKMLKTDPIKVYPPGANKPVGTFNQKNRISEKGITALIDNYMVSTNYRQNANGYPVIEDYWNPTFYVFRFYSSINKKSPLAVPIKSLHKDSKGYYVWRGKGQKVCQPDSVIDDKFQIEKVYVTPGDLKTLVYGACTDYILLKDSGILHEYDFLLGEKIPKDLKNNSTVVYRKHSYLFKAGDKLKVEIPNLFKPGFYVPTSSVIQKGSESYVYINDKGRTKLIEVSITGGNDKYYRIEGRDISSDTEVILLDDKFSKDIVDNCPVNVIAEINPIIGKNTSPVNVSILNLKETIPADTAFYGKIKPSDSSDIKFTTYKHYQGYINSTLRPGAYRMSAVRDLKGNVVNSDDSIVASIDDSVYEYLVKSADANVAKAKAKLDVAKIELARYKKLFEAKSQSEENFVKAMINYESVKADYAIALSDRLIAVNDYKRCSVHTAYAGIVNRVNMLPGTWTGRDYTIVNLQIMTPAGIDIKMDRSLAELTMKNYPIKVYPTGSDVPVGTLETKDMLSGTGVTSQLDNYFVAETNIENKNNYPVIEGHIDEVFYAYRFYSPLEENHPLSVPLESLYKDDKGYFVWKAEGQKVFQPDSVIASEFKITKIYVVPGDLKTYANGVCAKYRILKDPGKLKEYDVILGEKIPKNLKDGETVIYKKYKFLFEAGDIVKVEIPDLVKPGYYVPTKSVVQKGTDDSYVFINENGRAKLVKIRITGGCGEYYRIEGGNIKTGTDVIILDNAEIEDGMPVKILN